MKKLFLSLVAATVAATATYAQNTLVATLSHGQDVTMYYGSYAFRDAMDAAVSGDIINLSGGSFQSASIDKAITLRGAGIDSENPTYLLNNIFIGISTEDVNRFSMEGIRCSLVILNGTFSNPYFMKCQFDEIRYYSDSNVNNLMLVDCKVTNSFTASSCNGSSQFINCYVSGFDNQSPEDYSATFLNCVLYPVGGNSPEYFRGSQIMNSIFYTTESHNYSLPSTSVVSNCVSIGGENLFDDVVSKKDCTFATFEEVFKDFTGTYSDAQTFELTGTAKTTYLGTDETQVGLYGGFYPYSSVPSYPQITKMNVANKTTADGKLSVEIEVGAAQ